MKNQKNIEHKKRGLTRKEEITGWLFILPAMIGFGVFTLFPLAFSFFISFTSYAILEPGEFIGLQNFYHLFFKDPKFWIVLSNTFYFTFVSIPLSMVGSLVLAVLMNQKLKGITAYRAVYFIPVITSWVAVGLVWRWIYNPQFGLINYLLLKIFNIEGPQWLVSRRWAMPAIIIVNVWKTLGFNMVLYLAGLQGIPEQLYEAAKIDGAGKWHEFRHITVPLLTPTTFFILVMSIIQSFQVFSAIYIMTQGGPENATKVMVYYIWETGFQFFDMGYAASISWILFVIIFLFTLIQWRLREKWVFGE